MTAKSYRPTVADVMTKDVLTVTAQTPFKDIVAAFADRAVSGAPVVDDAGHVVGIVTEADLLRKEEFKDAPEERHRLFEHRRDRLTRRKARGDTAAELMTTPVMTVAPDTVIPAASRLIAEHGVKRLPVVDEAGRLVGIVSRADLLKMFLAPDDQIRRKVIDEVVVRTLWEDPRKVSVDVRDGVVTLEGQIELKSLIPFAERLTLSVDGVVDVVSRLTYEHDDSVLAQDPLALQPIWRHR
ncbi:CBS domain-containing protein [Planobispora takensis]|uniref:CBS domain-containing protein n=1 Tax=Planobispora takensis TaxID=1367882 RepID=A0A8J3T5W9_9ACTN|nr:CBS domain-containing protein [Planobispora takensis]GII05997.1 hypothetical protein Pta02_80050 [Planobispora takensis]